MRLAGVKLTSLIAAFIGIGFFAGMFYRPLLVPWMLASGIFLVNYALSLLFFQAITRLSTSAAAGVAVISFLLRFGLMGLGLLGVALVLPEYLVATAICFLVVYTIFFAFELSMGVRGRKPASPPAAGGEV